MAGVCFLAFITFEDFLAGSFKDFLLRIFEKSLQPLPLLKGLLAIYLCILNRGSLSKSKRVLSF